MRVLKPVLRSGAVRAVLCGVGTLYIRLLWRSGRWEIRDAGVAERLAAEQRPFIGCFWHGRMLMMPFSLRGGRHSRLHMLISSHRDGQLIARTVKAFGIGSVTGSTRKGGAAAFRSILRLLRDDESICFTPDGPRGPRMRVSPGIVQAARLSGAPILPVSYSARRALVISRSWDRFLVPLPFSRGLFLWGAPLEVPRDADDATLEVLRRRLENTLNGLTAEADRLCGRDPIGPAPETAR